MGADPTNPATYIDQFTAYVALLDVENLTFAAVPAYGLNGGPFTLWGRVFMDEGEWVNLGDPSTSPAVTSNPFFRLEQ